MRFGSRCGSQETGADSDGPLDGWANPSSTSSHAGVMRAIIAGDEHAKRSTHHLFAIARINRSSASEAIDADCTGDACLRCSPCQDCDGESTVIEQASGIARMQGYACADEKGGVLKMASHAE